MPRKELGMAGCNSGSCDSMASTASNHSQRSDNSYDYLSVEEKECLMFLEETIGSLDAEGDSGVSTDDTDCGEPPKPRKGPVPQGELQTLLQPGCAKGTSLAGREGGKEQCPSLVPHPCRQPHEQGTACALLVLTGRCAADPQNHGAQHLCNLGNGTPPPSRDQQRGAEQRNGKSSSASSSSAPAAAPSPGYSRLPRNVPAPNGASGSSVHTVPAGKAAQEVPREGRLDQASTGSRTKSVIIQPPDPFQDDLEWSRSHRSDTKSVIIQPPDPFQDDLEWSRSHRSAAKGEAARETKIWTFSDHPEKSTLEEAPQDPDAKRGPPTAPKPRKLPPNIILKTSRNSPVPPAMEHNQKVKAAPPPSATSHPSPASDSTAEKGNSGHLDPKEKEKARREALEKLGLSQDRRQPSAHLHPHPRETPLPIPGQPGGGSVPGIRQMAFKSNTLERSGVGLGSSMGSPKEQNARSSSSSLGKMSFIERLAPSFLRGSRPRPASLGAGKDFAGLKEQEEQDKSSKRRSHPLSSFPRPPRSAVSVKISPKGAADENRREALKKLGLLKE
ncbi:SARG protein, partial [Cnemophilus loriae]|nr:SARG protein [Cnemophilus loriae]